MSTITTDSESWIGTTLVDDDDCKLGTIEAIYFNEETGQPEWMAVKTGLFGTKHNFVPLADAMPTEDAIRTPYDKSQIDDAPKVDPDEDLREDQVLELYSYYGLPYDVPVDRDREIVERDVVDHDPSLTATDSGAKADRDMHIAMRQIASNRSA
jgi:hypothetical protein